MADSLDFLEDLRPTPAAYRAAARRLEALRGALPTPLRLAIAAGFTAQPLASFLVVEGARRGLQIRLTFAPYGQWEVACADPESEFYSERPEVVVIAVRIEDLLPGFWEQFEVLPDSRLEELAGEACERLVRSVAAAWRTRPAAVVVANFIEPLHGGWGVRRSPSRIVEYANGLLDRMGLQHPGTVVLDLARLALEAGLLQVYDARLEYVSRMPFSPPFQIALSRGLIRLVRALQVPAAKCLVLDLDDTLWGGVLGEAGPGGIALGEDYPGRVYRDFQRAVRSLGRRGTLLAIASKNNVAEVRAVFEEHPDMVLRWDDFAATEVHWGDKASSLRAIAAQLNIGLDALVFYDESPVEREWVRRELPEVTVIEVPADPLGRVAALEACEAFDQMTLSPEDRLRVELYHHNRQREHARSESDGLAGFLATLQIRIRTGVVDSATLPRVAQLIHKTNQFNLTSRRYTEAQLQAQLEKGAMACWLRASDRFGDYGLVGAAFALPAGPGSWRIDNFVLSCRILGRQVETALLAAIAERVAGAGAERLTGEYLPTPRNAPARDFYAGHHFQPEGDHWTWEFSRGPIPFPAHLLLQEPSPVIS